MKILLATRNQGKLKEMKRILRDMPIELLSLNDFPDFPEVIENRDSFEGNAYKKAFEISERSGLTTLADDSGLMVDALNGAPGVYSARFAGEDHDFAKNNQKLLRLMKGVPWQERTARFVCVMCLYEKSGDSEFMKGSCEGYITTKLRGNNGFGYDPLFYVESYGKTFGELSPEIKNQISHRAKALEKMKKVLSRKLNANK